MEKKTKKEILEIIKAKELLKISKNDLNSSKILFDYKKYSNAVFCLQQSVEKSMKAYSVINKLISFSELKDKIGHNPLRLYSKSAKENISKSKNLSKALEVKPELKESPMFKKLKLKEFEKGNQRVINIISQVNNNLILSEDIYELNLVIEEIKKLIKENIENPEPIKISKERIQEIKQNWIVNATPFVEARKKQEEKIPKNWEDEVNNISDKDMRRIIKSSYTILSLGGVSHTINFMLNLFLKPHFDFVRYPDKKNPLKYYNKSNPLIKKFSEILKIQEDNLNLHNKYIRFVLKSEKEGNQNQK